jgi:multidrug transporter EmrE-like cation transporter
MIFGLSWGMIAIFLLSVSCQIIGIGLLPKTQGYTHIGFSMTQLAFYGIAFAALAQLIKRGGNLSILVPLMSAVTPLAAIVIGVLLYGENATPAKIGLLLVSCVTIAAASRF